MENSARHVKRTFTGNRIKFTYTQQYTAPVEEVFPLLCPVREYEYLPAWECDLVYLATGTAEEGGIFTTDFPQDVDKDVWVMSQYVPNKIIQFVRLNSLRVIVYNVKLQSDKHGGTSIYWEQITTGINQRGNDLIETLHEADFVELLKSMETLLQHYLDTGEMMSL